MPEILVPVAKGKYDRAWPKHEDAKKLLEVPVENLFTREFPFDAFAFSYRSPPEGSYRLSKDYERIEDLEHVLLFADLDAHKLQLDALEAWKADALIRSRAVLRRYPGLLYPTSGGVRLAWRISVRGFRAYEHLGKTFFAHLADLGLTGIDMTAVSFARLMRLPNVRRDGEDQRPTVEGSLKLLRFDPGPVPEKRKAPMARPKRPRGAPVDDAEIARAIGLGLAREKKGVFLVTCPTASLHSDGSADAAVFPGGGFNCFHESCRNAGTSYQDWAGTLPPDLTNPPVSLDEAAEMIRAAVKAGGRGQELHVVDLPPGVGKTHTVLPFLAPGAIIPGIDAVLFVPTVTKALEIHEETGCQIIASVSIDLPGRSKCVQPKTVGELHAMGLSAQYACKNCPERDGCTAAKPVGDKTKGTVATHAGYAKFEGKTFLAICDEKPALTETFEIVLAEIPGAMAATASDWRRAVQPWASSLAFSDPDERAKERAFEATEIPAAAGGRVPMYDEHFDASILRKTFGPLQVAQAVRSAAHPSAVVRFQEGKAFVTRMSGISSFLRERGGTLLAAGISDVEIKALRSDAMTHRARVLDAVAVTRELVRTEAKTTFLEEHPERLAELVAEAVRRAGGRETLLVLAKSLAVGISIPDTVKVRTFGALRGLNEFKNAEVFITIGDHYQNLGAVAEEAKFLGVEDGFALARGRIAEELLQVHGRARDPRRTKTCLHLHFGKIAPSDWIGRFETLTWDECVSRSLIQALGQESGLSIREQAEKLGVSPATIQRARSKAKASSEGFDLGDF